MSNRHKIVIASGFMDCLHQGHVEYFEKAKALGGWLIVIVNNAEQAVAKKGYEFMPFEERKQIVAALRCVDEVVGSIDTDSTVCKSIEKIVNENTYSHSEYIFAKGGDRFAGEIPEAEICRKLGIEIVDGLGDKIQSSSDLVKKSKERK